MIDESGYRTAQMRLENRKRGSLPVDRGRDGAERGSAKIEQR
jgi:hypothetical protein